MQALHPVHFEAVTRTTPPSATWDAPVGHAPTHGVSPHWLHRSERICIERWGKVPHTSCTTQSRNPPSGSAFSVLQAITQALQPTQRRVSTAMPYRLVAMSGGLPRPLDADEVHVHAGAAHDGVDLVPAGQLGVRRAAAVGVALAARPLAPAVDEVDAVPADALGELDLHRRRADPVLVHEDDALAVLEGPDLEPGEAPRRVGVEPDLVLRVGLGEQPVVDGAPEGVERRAPREQAERPRGPLLLRPVDRERVEPERRELLREELDLAAVGGGADGGPLLL